MVTTSDPKTEAPKYQQIADQLRTEVRRGHFKPGEQLPSFAEMRRRHNISRGTVEKIHQTLEREGLVVRQQGRGTFVADQRRDVETNLIGFCGAGFKTEIHTPFWLHLLQGIREAAREADKSIVLLEYGSTGWNKVAGALVSDTKANHRLRATPVNCPLVSMLHSLPGHASVIADDYEGGRVATQHLTELGHRRIAFLESTDNPLVKRRLAGYRAALEEAGVALEPKWVRFLENIEDDYRLAGARATREWLHQDWRELGCTALVAQNDQTAIGAIESLREAKIAVPEQVSVIGYDGTEVCESSVPRLTSIGVPVREIGKTAMQILLRALETQEHNSATTMIPVTLQVRDSTAPVNS